MTLTAVRTELVDATPLPRPSRERSRIAASEALIVAALLLGWLVVYVLFGSTFEANHAQKRLYSELRTSLALGEAPSGAPIGEGTPLAVLAVPNAGIRDLVVVEGTRPADLNTGPGHLAGSVLPGQAGTSVLLGRRVGFGGPFGDVAALRPGDGISVRTVQGLFRYRVSGLRHTGDPLPSALADGGARLTLVTADGGNAFSASRTVYVDATLDGTAQPAGAISASDPQGRPFARDTSLGTLALLALALELLVGSVVWMVWAGRRWSLLAGWITGVPLVLAALWVSSSVASRLLPNLL